MSLNPSIRKVVPASPPSAIASYDYTDIAEGTGIKNFYAAQSIASGAASYFLTTDDTLYSGVLSEKVQDQGGTVSIINYETTFNMPKTIKGKIRISVTLGVDGSNVTSSVVLSLWKVSGATTTQIGDTVGTEKLTEAGPGQYDRTRNVTIEAADRVHFKKGDTLRLTVKLIGLAGASETFGYGCDPANRSDTTSSSGGIIIAAGHPTQLKVGIPFVLTDM